MKTHFLIFILALFLESLFIDLRAQGIISGHVKNVSGESLVGCSVMLLQSDSIIGGTITDSHGDFGIQGLNAGSYSCRVSMLGYKSVDHTFQVNYKVKLPDFVLEEDPVMLQEVQIEGDRRNAVQQRAGSSTYFLSEHAKQSNTAFEALREIPKLRVNSVTKSIGLSDGSSPLILINGVKRANYVNLLDPKLIESVEIIDNPSARYRGEESVGSILNIKMKRNVSAYMNGEIYAQHSPIKQNGAFGQNVEVGKSTSSLYLNMMQFYFGNDHSENSLSTSTPDLNQHLAGKKIHDIRSYSATLGGDHIISDKDYLAFSLTYIGNPSESKSHQQGKIAYPKRYLISDATVHAKEKNKFYAPNAHFYYKHSFNQRQSLELTGFYSYSMNASDNERQEKNDFFLLNNHIDYNNQRHYGKVDLDYLHPLGRKHRLSVGSNTSYASTDIDDRADILPLYNHQHWQEYIYAGIDNNDSNSKFNYSLSLGVDYIRSNADGSKNDYTNLLPNASLSYRFNAKHALKLKYMRVRMSPSVSQLNPRNSSNDSLHVQVGNPYLTPVLVDEVALNYNLQYKGFYFTPQITYAYYADWIAPVGWLQDNVYIDTYANQSCVHQLQFSTEMGYNFNYGNVGVLGYYRKHIQHGMQYSGDIWYGNLFANFYYKQWNLNFYIQYQNASYSRFSKSETRPFCNLTLSRQLPKNWNVSLYLENFIFTGAHDKNWISNADYASFSSFRMKDRCPVVRLSITYTFRNKVEQKWRNKKRFYNSDRELQNIKAY